MDATFPVYVVRKDMMLGHEQVGSKRKFWLRHEGRKGLFKYARADSGEHWAERIAAELASLLDLPHAEYDLAECEDGHGVLSWSFLRDVEDEPEEEFFFGNYILAGLVRGYPRVESTGRHRRTPEHTVDTVLGTLQFIALPLPWTPPEGIQRAADVMVGYLLLDALIGNTDRHDLNWGLLRDPSTSDTCLAPTFDHASSLGRELSDKDRLRRLDLRMADRRVTVESYVQKATSGLYAPGGVSPLHPLEAFRRAAVLRPEAAAVWIEKLGAVASTTWSEIVARVPPDWMTEVARAFTIGILETTCRALLTRPR